MNCRFPGKCDSPERYWEFISDGRHFRAPLPPDRGWDLGRLTHPDPDVAGVTRVRHGGFLNGVGDFDAAFFGIGPREAMAMDPQQRLVLQCAWGAVEDSRTAPSSLRGSRTSVYVGISDSSYLSRLGEAEAELEAYMATGVTQSAAAGRISYVLGLHGPALSVDTACSSSLAALHLATQSVRSGECDSAIAAGVCVMAGPDVLVYFSRAGAVATDGRCKAFAAEADGFAPAEGVAAVMLMSLSRARAQGLRVLALVRGTALNEDGTGEGLAVPNGAAQRAVIADALRDAGLRPDQIGMVEAHGTGTPVGDPIEAATLLDAYGAGRSPNSPLWVGSVKSNIGHTQAAAGLAGVVKTVLALRHEKMPATLHAANPTTAVDWSAETVRLLQAARPWPRGAEPRRAGVLAYGVSGTNAHVVIEEAPRSAAGERVRTRRQTPVAWPLYASSPEALPAQAEALARQVRAEADTDAAAVGLSLATTRAPLRARAVVTGSDTATLLDGLDALAEGRRAEVVTEGRAAETDAGGQGPVFVFPGQGAQWEGMGARLLDESPVFAEAFARCARALRPWTEFDVEQVVRAAPGAPSLERAEVVQPALFAMYVSLAELWRAYGVRPSAVIGHSQGEIAAACVGGLLPLEQAARVVGRRSRLLRAVTSEGAMASLAVPADRAEALLAPWAGRLETAVANGPAASVVSGDAGAVEELLAVCKSQDVWARRIPVDYASHSHHMDVVRDALLSDLGDLVVADAADAVPMFSTTTDKLVTGRELDADYWYRNIRRPVRFDSAVRRSLQAGGARFIEISPHPVLTGPLRDILSETRAEGSVSTTLHRDHGGFADFVSAMGAAHAVGTDLDWHALYPRVQPVDLPTYRFQGRRYWPAPSRRRSGLAAAGLEEGGHPLLAAACDLPDGAVVLSGRLSQDDQPWLADHAVHGTVLVPATGMVELMLCGARRTSDRSRLEDVVFHTPLIVPDTPVDIQLHCADDGGGRHLLRLHSRSHGGTGAWTLHAEAQTPGQDAGPAASRPPGMPGRGTLPWPPHDAEEVAVADCYQALEARGYAYGPQFRNLTAVWRRGGTWFTQARLDETAGSDGYTMHPALLDSLLHGLLMDGDSERTMLPYAIGSVEIFTEPHSELRARLTPRDGDSVQLEAVTLDGRTAVRIEDLRLRPTSALRLRAALAAADSTVFTPRWEALPPPPAPGRSQAREYVAAGPCEGLAAERACDDMAAVADAAAAGEIVPAAVVLDCRADDTDTSGVQAAASAEMPTALQRRLARVLREVQTFLRREELAPARLVAVTCRIHPVAFGDQAADPVAAACAGLLRSAGNEHPGRVLLVDTDAAGLPSETLTAALAVEDGEVAVRGGRLFVQRLKPAHDGMLALPADEAAPWRLAPAASHTIEDVRAVPVPSFPERVAAGEVRIRVHATGLNFRDAVMSLGMVRGEAIGFEVGGIVTQTGAGVEGLHPGDRVAACLVHHGGGYATLVDVDQHMVLRIPDEWSLNQAATVTGGFLTAHYALVDLAEVRPGDKVLIHAAAGGVGMAAVQLARALGAEVYATASHTKQELVASLGVPRDRIADSRSLSFEQDLRQVCGGAGFDIVLGSLAKEFVDASLRLLGPGGRYLEMGKTDLRDPGKTAEDHPGITYRAFDLADHPAPGAALRQLMAMFRAGQLTPLPLRTWPIGDARDALRFLSQGRSTGKLALTQSAALAAEETVLITGGTGTLGSLLARHLAHVHGVRHLLLLSRQGEHAPGAADLVEELAALGATATVAACDASNRADLAHALSRVPARHPVTTVIHTAGVLDDGLVGDLTPARLRTVLRAKADAAWHLHELTRELNLGAFVLYSSMAGLTGNAGQANYAAANAFLDALAHHRRQQGLPAVSISWGLWQETSNLTSGLRETDRIRLARQGLTPLKTQQALAAFDAALNLDHPHVAVTAVSRRTAGQAPAGLLAALHPRRPTTPAPACGVRQQADERDRLAAMAPAERLDALTDLVRTHAAAVLGHRDKEGIDAGRRFRDLGFDSLATVELRTRLDRATGIRLAATAVFDHPTPARLAEHLSTCLTPNSPPPGHESDALTKRVLDLWEQSDIEEGRELLRQATARRRRGSRPGELRVGEWELLNEGPAAPALLCLPPFIATATSSCYARLAELQNGVRQVWTGTLPGLRDDEPLPESVDTLAQAWAESLAGSGPCHPYVLLGHSSGGLLAHALAHALQNHGTPVHGVVLLDPPVLKTAPGQLAREVISRISQARSLVTPAMLTAVGGYADLFQEWAIPPLDAPVLLLHPQDSDLPRHWTHPHTPRPVPGDHFSLLEDHTAPTVRAIEAWLTGLPGRSSLRQPAAPRPAR
jgi:acyl transferase domain-containing protein/NADPH:quinone reductase-like Zn-dependent oxidoreductase/acyl carrier protein